MKRSIRYIIYIAVVCLVFLPSWASDPGDTPFSEKLASLDTKADRPNNFSAEYRNTGHYDPAPNIRPHESPISEPTMMFLLGTALIGFSIVGRKMTK